MTVGSGCIDVGNRLGREYSRTGYLQAFNLYYFLRRGTVYVSVHAIARTSEDRRSSGPGPSSETFDTQPQGSIVQALNPGFPGGQSTCQHFYYFFPSPLSGLSLFEILEEVLVWLHHDKDL